MHIKNTLLILLIALVSCGNISKNNTKDLKSSNYKKLIPVTDSIITGAQQVKKYLEILKNKKVGIVGNQTSVIYSPNKKAVHVVDSLLKLNLNIIKVFAPEHGFRGNADAGAYVKDGVDQKTGLPIISLYGKNKKPSNEMLQNLDIVIFDIQDVGARFYTYISTLHYVMEACAENNIPVLILDRPNPNGHYVDGPILDKKFKSFVGMHPIPIVHGMTIGEYAKMINGEKWLANDIQCDLKIIGLQNYTHQTSYSLPIKPSPNLPNDRAINLYPSLCFFEGTKVSVGRGTNMQFQIYGAPDFPENDFHFTPKPNLGALHPKFDSEKCFGKNLTFFPTEKSVNLAYIIDAYSLTSDQNKFFTPFFNKLAGNDILQKQIKAGVSEAQIRASWKNDLNEFKITRKKYLLYP